MVKDRQISVIRLDGEVRGSCSEKRLLSADEKNQNCLETGGRVGGNCCGCVLFRRLSIRFRIDDMKVN